MRHVLFNARLLRIVLTGTLAIMLFNSHSHEPLKGQSDDSTSETFNTLNQDDLQVITANVQRPNGITWFNNKLYTACTGDGTVYEINDTDGTTTTYIYGVTNAHMMVAEAEGMSRVTLWVPDFGDNTFERIQAGSVSQLAGDLQGPWGITAIDDDRFLITELLGNRISTMTREGEQTVVLEDLASPAGIARDDEFVYIANNGSTRRAIEWYPLDDVVDGTVEGRAIDHILVRGLQNAAGLSLAPDGYLYFTYALGTRGVVGRVDPAVCREAGGCTNDQVEIVLYTELPAPLAGLLITPDMRLFVHAMFNPTIYWVQLDQ